MIRVDKNLDDIPASLDDRKTETRRNSCIRDKKYHQKKEFHQRYKQEDIKRVLKKIYHQKCAFCEQEIIECKNNDLEDCSSTIEHYRPKSKYYWLAYSWDNLLLCCYGCNKNKGNSFKIEKSLGTFNKIAFLKRVHHSSKIYNRIEKPSMIHPEFENIIDKLEFDKNGGISSDNIRVKYTIETCEIDRDALKEKRKTVIDDFIENIIDKKLKKESINKTLQEFLNDLKKQEKEFIALRYWILKNYKSLVEEN